jgi:hypothetical protein
VLIKTSITTLGLTGSPPDGYNRRRPNIGLQFNNGDLLEFSQTAFSLPKQFQGVRFKKTLLLSRKPVGNDWNETGAVNQI